MENIITLFMNQAPTSEGLSDGQLSEDAPICFENEYQQAKAQSTATIEKRPCGKTLPLTGKSFPDDPQLLLNPPVNPLPIFYSENKLNHLTMSPNGTEKIVNLNFSPLANTSADKVYPLNCATPLEIKKYDNASQSQASLFSVNDLTQGQLSPGDLANSDHRQAQQSSPLLQQSQVSVNINNPLLPRAGEIQQHTNIAPIDPNAIVKKLLENTISLKQGASDAAHPAIGAKNEQFSNVSPINGEEFHNFLSNQKSKNQEDTDLLHDLMAHQKIAINSINGAENAIGPEQANTPLENQIENFKAAPQIATGNIADNREQVDLGQYLVKPRESQVTLNLSLQELGNVQIEIKQQENQTHLLFLSQHENTKQLLANNMDQLSTRLEQNGIQLGNVFVSHQEQQQPQQQPFYQSIAHPLVNSDFENAGNAQESTFPVKSDNIIDLYA